MSSFTKKAILESFLHLVGKKNFDKITVRDIVDDCGVNRNTFYYYFQDIYAVVEEIAGSVLHCVPCDLPLSLTLSRFFSAMCDFSAAYPRAARGLTLSFGFEGLERHFASELERMILHAIERDTSFLPEARPELARLLCHATLGACLSMMRAEKGRPDHEEQKRRFGCAIEALLAPATSEFG